MLQTYQIPSTDVRVNELPKVGRKLRKPSINFQARSRAFEIQPFFIHPVLPGETMKNLLLQAKAVTPGLKSPFLGWWGELYFFYVKLRDLPERATIEQMLIANTAPPAAGAADARCFYAGEGVNWVRKCLDRVVECYFRDEEEVANALTYNSSSGMPLSKITTLPGWMENLTAHGDAPASDGTPLPGDHFPELPEHLTAFSDAYTQWKEMQSLQLTPPSFEDYLKTFGIRPPVAAREEKHIPELIRYVREWKQPANTVGETGAMNSQVVWNLDERADKDRFFSEPGFIFGVQTFRPKLYSATQKASMVAFMNDAYSWLPALLRPDPFTSLKKFAFGGDGPLANQTEDYWVDMADVLIGGDQFVSFDVATAGDAGAVGTPHETGTAIDVSRSYMLSTTDEEALFTDITKKTVKVEGRIDLSILTSLQDTTP